MSVRGKSLGWGEKERAESAAVSQADVERAAVMWRTNAPDKAKDILDARAE